MYNEKLNASIIHLKQASLINPIFYYCTKAISSFSLENSFDEDHPFQYNQNNHSSSAKYIVIQANQQIPQPMFQCKYLCPVFRTGSQKSYIAIKGDNLWDYYRMKKNKQIILSQQQLWILLKQITQALFVLHQYGYNHIHLKQYAIYRKNEHNYQLVFHPRIKSMQELAYSSKFYWYDFYLAPEQLQIKHNDYSNDLKTASHSQIFSLAMIVLNVMNPFDFNRNIYSKKQYAIDWTIVKDKLKNAKLNYSKDLTQLVQNCLKQYPSQRYTLTQLRNSIQGYFHRHIDKMSHFNKIASSLIKSKGSSSKSSPNKKSNSLASKYSKSPTSSLMQNQQRQQIKNKQNIVQKQKMKKKQQIYFSPPPSKWKKQELYNYNDTVQRKKQLQNALKQKKKIKVQKIQLPTKSKTMNLKQKSQQDINDTNQKHNSTNDNKVIQQQQSLKFKKTFKIGKKHLQNKNLKAIKQQKQNSLRSSRNQIDPQNQKQFSFQRGTFGFEFEPQSPQFKGFSHQNKAEITQNINQDSKKQEIKKSCIVQQSKNVPQLTHQEQKMRDIDEQNQIFEQTKIEFFYKRIEQINKKLSEIKIQLNIKTCLQQIQILQNIVGQQGVWIDGDIYFGSFKNGRRNGLGLELFPEGQYYFGNFKDDFFHGEGFYFWNKFQYFIGLFENGIKTIGTLYGSKLIYYGEFSSNKMQGIGKATYPDGQIYIGQWKNRKKQGIGLVIHATGDKFYCQWQKGKKYGSGILLSEDFSIKAFWKKHQIIGNCFIEYKSGYTYQGGLKLQQDQFYRQGYGIYKFPKGGYFKGTFHQNEATHGEILYKNGQKYIGTLKQMKRHGFGEYHYLNGTVHKGRWINDAKVQVQKQKLVKEQ